MSFSNVLRALLILLLSLPLIGVLLMFEKTEQVSHSGELTASELETVQNFIINNDPRALLRGQNRTIRLNPAEADALLRYFFSQIDELGGVSGLTRFGEGEAELLLSIPVDAAFIGQFLNVRVAIDDSALPLHITGIDIGDLHLPDALISPLIAAVDRQLAGDSDYDLLLSLLNSVNDLQLTPDLASFAIQFNDEQLSGAGSIARDFIFTPPEQSRVVDYYTLIMALEQELLDEGSTRASLNRFLQTLFQQAYENVLEGEDPTLENRAVFLALSVYLTGLEPEQVTAQPLTEAMQAHERRVRVTLNGRLDLAQHLVTSATIASTSSPGLTQLISVYKEVIDSRTRSGFSFDDMMANAVGTAIGDLATETQSVAHRFQFIMKDVSEEAYYMPATTNAPTLSEAEFSARFGDRTSTAWQQKLAEMEEQIEARPLFSTFDVEVNLGSGAP